MRRPKISKKYAFFRCALFFGEKQNLETRCIKQHAFLVDPLGVSYDFLYTPTFFLTHQKRWAQTKKGARNLAPASKFRSSVPPRGCHSDRKGSQKGERGPGRAGPVHAPVFSSQHSCLTAQLSQTYSDIVQACLLQAHAPAQIF